MIYRYLFGAKPVSVIYYFLISNSKAIGIEYRFTKEGKEKITDFPAALIDDIETVQFKEKLEPISSSNINLTVLHHAIRIAFTLNESELKSLRS